MTAPLGIYGTALRQAAQGRDAVMHLIDAAGEQVRRIDPTEWTTELRPGDGSLLSRCAEPVLDVGCGPGRLATALARAGHRTLGIDVSAEAVRQARRRGATAQRRDVFGPLPDEGRWCTVLLADGNIGIGGDPVTLLARGDQLLAPHGRLLVEVGEPGDQTWSGYVRLSHAHRRSTPFPWANVSTDDIAAVATRAGLRVHETWTEGRRWFAHLGR